MQSEGQSVPTPRVNQQSEMLHSSGLWQTDHQAPDRWVCTLAHVLLGFASSPTLRHLKQMALRKASLAELLLPDAVRDVLTSNEVSAVAVAGMARQITDYVLLNPAAELQCVRAVLNCLEHLRSAHLDAVSPHGSGGQAHGRTHVGSHGDASTSARKPGGRAGAAAGKKGAVTQSRTGCAAWPKVYCLNIDYLAVARAAVRCSAYFTGLLYIELWCEASFRSLSFENVVSKAAAADSAAASAVSLLFGPNSLLSAAIASKGAPRSAGRGKSSAKAPGDAIQIMEALLLEIFSNVNEPDAIYAVAALSSGAASQPQVHEKEGAWVDVLCAYDLMAQQVQQREGAALDTIEITSGSHLIHASFKITCCMDEIFLIYDNWLLKN